MTYARTNTHETAIVRITIFLRCESIAQIPRAAQYNCRLAR